MKKSKILIPAAAMILVSAGSAVTGSVAWFRSSRKASVEATSISLVNTNTGLVISDISNIAGTTASKKEGSNIAASVTHDASFRDGSVDIANGKVYYAEFNAASDVSAHVEVENKNQSTTESPHMAYKYEGANVAEAYSISFKASNTSSSVSTDKNYLFFQLPDTAPAAPRDVSVYDTAQYAAYKGFRVGVKCGDNIVVWAPYLSAITSNNSKYASASGEVTESNPKTSTYTNIVYGKKGDVTGTDITDSVTVPTTANSNALYLGEVPSNNTAITCTVWTWFEGYDINVQTAYLDTVHATSFAVEYGFVAIKAVNTGN